MATKDAALDHFGSGAEGIKVMLANSTNGQFSTDLPDLLQRHLDALQQGSGLDLEIIRQRGYQSVLGKKHLADAGFARSQQRPPGLLLPVHTPDGRTPLHSYRPDFPREVRGKELKYELPSRTTARLDVPPRCIEAIKDPWVDLWITEGQKKADALATHNLCAVALLGVWNFKGKNEFGGVTLLADFDEIALNGRTVNIVFDSDLMVKPQVRAALDRLTEHMERRGGTVNAVYLPDGLDSGKVGVDDYLLTYSVDELEQLVKEPAPAPKAAAPAVVLLDEAPAMLSRPLGIVDGHSYAATWLWVETTERETFGKNGEVIRHDPPLVSQKRQLIIVRGDGIVYEPSNMESLPIRVNLPDIPPEHLLWRTKGVKAYRAGKRPDYASVFFRIVTVYQRFIDFSQSFADQDEMSQLSACFSLATWFLDAFMVIGYPWSNGERGSGKTQWGFCWAYTSYLGIVVLASGSFAALRDLADYGATLLFDDAENLSDVKRTDPEKRALLLAGNRRGVVVPIKVPAPDERGWETKYINAFGPRGFTAISLPDPVLGSRSIRIPLVRTSDPQRGNADPADLKRWPCDQKQLQDDLWATGLALLPEAAEIWADLDDETELVGREFEPWRPILATARLFESHGVDGLEERMRATMWAYQEEKADIDTGDRATQVIKAILKQEAGDRASDVLDISDMSDVFPEGSAEIKVEPSKLKPIIENLGEEEGFNTEWASPNSIGWQLKALRLKRGRNPATRKRERFWTITTDALIGLCQAYGVVRAFTQNASLKGSNHDTPDINVRIGQNGRNVRTEDEVRV